MLKIVLTSKNAFSSIFLVPLPTGAGGADATDCTSANSKYIQKKKIIFSIFYIEHIINFTY